MPTRRILTGTITLSVIALAGCAGAGSSPQNQSTVLRYSAIPDQNTTELQEKFQPLSEYLSRQLGVVVGYVPARDYQASVELFVNGDVGLAWYGGLTGVQAREKVAGARAIAQGDVDAQYYSYFIAHKDTGLSRSDAFPSAIGGYAFTFGSEQSTSGRLMPEYFITQHTGKPAKEFFTEGIGFSGSHDRTAELVASGQYQVGVINYLVYDQRVAQGKTDPDLVRVIWQTPPYADYNWTVRPDLDEKFGAGFTARLQEALLKIDDARLLAALPRERLVAASNDQYDGIRHVAQQLDMLR